MLWENETTTWLSAEQWAEEDFSRSLILSWLQTFPGITCHLRRAFIDVFLFGLSVDDVSLSTALIYEVCWTSLIISSNI